MTSTALGAIPFVEEALRWLPDVPKYVAEVEIPENQLMPVPCPPVSEGTGISDARPRILVADDNSDMRQYLVRMLSERYRVHAVPDGQAALEEIRNEAPDLVLTDVMMPRLDGFGLLRALRADPATQTIPIIVLSARAGEEARVEGMQEGADDYLIKPFSARELLARVQTHLELSRVRKQAAQALSLRTAQFETLFNEAPVSIFLIDGDLRIREMNPPARKAFGNVPHLIGEDFDKVIRVLTPPVAADEIVQRIRHTLETGEPHFEPERVEYRADLDATLIFEWQLNRISLPDGGYGVVSYFRDITAHVRTREVLHEREERLRQARDRFELVTEAAQVGIWFCDLPFDKLIWDHRVKEHFWLPPETDVTIDMFYERLHPDDRQRTRQAIEDSISTGNQYDIEYRTVAADGRQKWIRAIGRTFYREDGRPKSFDGLTLDITDRKRAEERERQTKMEAIAATAKFRALFEQTPVFAGVMTVDGKVIDVNRLCLDACGYRADEVLGKFFWDTAWWRKSNEVQSKIKAATEQAARGIPSRELLPYHWADGTERVVDFALHPILDEQGNILFLHPTGVDITDLKRAEEQARTLAESLEAEVRARTRDLEQRNVEVLKKSEQLRDLSHRLIQTQDDERRYIARELHDSAGQTLTVLGMNLSMLVNKAKKTDPGLVKIAEEGEQLVRDLSREIRTTSYLLHPPLLDESGISEALQWYIRGLSERSGLSIELSMPEDFGRLSRETELAIFRIVQECLTNVHRHSGSKVAGIRIVKHSRDVVIEVHDEGKGISADRLAELQSQGGGVGIRGMRERVFQLGGELKIQSREHGTTVTVTLPVAKAFAPTLTGNVEEARAAD